MFDPQVAEVAVSAVAVVAAFVAGVVVEDRVMIVPRVRGFIADVKARFSRVKDAVK
jgi:hypothetical protein